MIRSTSWSSEIFVKYYQICWYLSHSYLLYFVVLPIHDFYANITVINIDFVTLFCFLTSTRPRACTEGKKWCLHLCSFINKQWHYLCSVIRKWCWAKTVLSPTLEKRCQVGPFKTCHFKVWFVIFISVLNVWASLQRSKQLDSKFGCGKFLFCLNQKAILSSSVWLLVCLVFLFWKECLEYFLSYISSCCLIRLKRKTFLFAFTFIFH